MTQTELIELAIAMRAAQKAFYAARKRNSPDTVSLLNQALLLERQADKAFKEYQEPPGLFPKEDDE
jgi:hypothetical protein